MERSKFRQLQKSITAGTDFKLQDVKEALTYDPESPESFSTFAKGLKLGKLDPSKLLVTAALMAIEIDPVYIRYAGLALRFGANPNLYVDANFTFETETEEADFETRLKVPVHLAKKLWDVTPRTMQESVDFEVSVRGDFDPNTPLTDIQAGLHQKQKAALDILSMMAIMGMVSDAQLTTAELLTRSDINATRFATEHPDFFSSVYGSIKTDTNPEDPSDDFGSVVADEIKYFEQWKGSLQDAYGANPERDDRIFTYAVYLDRSEVLTLNNIYGNLDNYESMFLYQDTESLKAILPRMKELGLIGVNPSNQVLYTDHTSNVTQVEAERKRVEHLILDWCIAYYNLDVMIVLLDLGIQPDYTFRTQTIQAAAQVCNDYSVQCQILNSMIIEYVKRGYGLDKVQLEVLYGVSKRTYEAVIKKYSTPAWKASCQVRTDQVSTELREMAREVGLPVDSNKNQICDSFEAMTKSDPATLKKTIYEVNRTKIGLSSISAADIISGRRTLSDVRDLPSLGDITVDQLQQTTDTQNIGGRRGASGKTTGGTVKLPPRSTTKAAPLCTNQDAFIPGRPIEDYPSTDRVTYNDGLHTWCFTSENFEDLLRTGINPWAINAQGTRGDHIPAEILSEMQQKYDTIRDNNLPTGASISKGVDRLYDAKPASTEASYERQSKEMVEKFYRVMEDYDIPRERFMSLNSADLQIIADNVLSSTTRIVVDQSSPVLAIRQFANAVFTEAINHGNMDDIAASLVTILYPPVAK